MRLSINKVRDNTNEIDITAIGSKVKHVTSEGQHLRCVLWQLLFVYLPLRFGDLRAPLLNHFLHEFEGRILEQLLFWLFVEVVLVEHLLDEFVVDETSNSLNLEGFSIE